MANKIIQLALALMLSLSASSIYADTVKGKIIKDSKENVDWKKLGYSLVMSDLQVLYSKNFNKPYSKNRGEIWHTKLNVGILSKGKKYYFFVGKNNTAVDSFAQNPDEAYVIQDIVEIKYGPNYKLILNSRPSLEDMQYIGYANFCLFNDEYQSSYVTFMKRHEEEDEVEYRVMQAYNIDERKLTISKLQISNVSCECRANWCES